MVTNNYSSTPKNTLAKCLLQTGRFFSYPVHQVINVASKVVSDNTKLDCQYSNYKKALPLLLRKIIQVAALIVVFIPAVILALIGIPLCIIGNKLCSNVSLIKSTYIAKTYIPEQGIYIASYNTHLQPKYMSNMNNLRSPNIRAVEIADNIAFNGNTQPDIICFQEVYDRNASCLLFKKLQHSYSHIVHNIAPNEIGLNSGLSIASKFPIVDIKFHPFEILNNYISPNKGLLKVTVNLGDGKLAVIYNTHLQDKTDEKYREIRFNQLSQIKNWITEDNSSNQRENKVPHAVFFMGDLNMPIAKDEDATNYYCEYNEGISILGDGFFNRINNSSTALINANSPNTASVKTDILSAWSELLQVMYSPHTDSVKADIPPKQEPTGARYNSAESKLLRTSKCQTNSSVATRCISNNQFIVTANNQQKWASHLETRDSTHLPTSVIYKESSGFKNILDRMYQEKEYTPSIKLLLRSIMQGREINPLVRLQQYRQEEIAAKRIFSDEELAELDYIEMTIKESFKRN